MIPTPGNVKLFRKISGNFREIRKDATQGTSLTQ